VRALVFTAGGGAAVEQRPDPEPAPDEVVVAVRYAGLSPADAHQRAGRYPPLEGKPADVGGMEVAGTVLARGDRVTRWNEGDRVFGFVGGGALAERVPAHELALARTPEALDDREAASVPSSFLSAHDAISQAELRAGQAVLVHGGAGGFGTAAIQLAGAAGARVLAAVRSPEARAAVEDLGAEAVDDDGFADAVLERTGGRGAEVILETIGAPHFPANLDAIAPRGRIVVLGVGGGDEATVPLVPLMRKRVTLRGTTLRGRSFAEQALAVRALEDEVVPLFERGAVRAVVDSVHPVDRADEAFERLLGPGKVGNVVLDFGG
jgi:NADPH:quinone reductase-like Zn-dependent oxidoreductase